MVRLSALLLLSGCAFAEIDYTGKTCPCPADYGCTTSGTCCKPAIQAENFRVAWTAPNTIRFEWDPIGDEASFSAYRLRFGTGADPSGPSSLMTGDDNPQFRYFVLPEVMEATHRVNSAMLLDLVPSTPYWAELQAFDSTGCVWTSPTVFATTQVEPLADQVPIEIFDDTVGVGWAGGPLPPEQLLVSDPNAACNDNVLQWAPPTMTSEDTNIQIFQLGIPLAPAGLRLESSAFIEYKIARDADSYWARVLLTVEDPNYSEGGRHARLEGMSLRGDNQWHTVQVPIRALPVDANAPPYQSSDILHRFLIGFSPWEIGQTARLDCVRIRW